MPNAYTENAQRWLALSEVDYLAHYVKAWTAFNAWYRNMYSHKQDRQILTEIKWNSNSVRNKIIPLITNPSEEGEQFRSYIGALHNRLENYELHSGTGDQEIRISLKQVVLKKNPFQPQNQTINKMKYEIKQQRIDNKNLLVCCISNQSGSKIFNFQQSKYNAKDLLSNPDFARLSASQRNFLKTQYLKTNPYPLIDLTLGENPPITAGTYQFKCTPEELFAGICEVTYLMRNTLFHGELVPSHDAEACYEPAYHIVRKFLLSIS